MIYTASDLAPPSEEERSGAEGFVVCADAAGERRTIARWLSLSEIHSVAVGGCACGFILEDPVDIRNGASAVRMNRATLAAFLREKVDGGASMELLACWTGDEERAPRDRGSLAPGDILTGRADFAEANVRPELFRIVSESGIEADGQT